MATQQPPVTSTTLGALSGRWQHEVAEFLGVAYAAPPVGSARFTPPQPARAWTGTRDATEVAPAAPQPLSRLEPVMGRRVPEQDEDCLSLNVWTPGLSGAGRPVFVFLHGGAFTTGSGGLNWYSGDELARRGDIVVVTLNYRLGALGFLRLDGLADGMGAGNLGLLDQIQALRWIRENIAAFGGDPERVTVAGQSAGALSILGMLSGSAAPGLFHRAILQSTPASLLPPQPDRATDLARLLLRTLDIQEVSLLRTHPIAEIIAAQQEVARQARRGPLDIEPPFHLCAEPGLVAEDPVTEVGNRAGNGIPLMLGFTAHEGEAFFAGNDAVSGPQRAEVTEDVFRAPALRLAAALAEHGNPAWVYRFDWHPEGNPFGACHCIELPFVFGNPDDWHDAPMLHGAEADTLASLTAAMQDTWISFVRTGDPQHNGIPHWPAYSAGSPVTMRYAAWVGGEHDELA